LTISLYNIHENAVCIPSSVDICSFEKVNPGKIPFSLIQKSTQNGPLNIIPSTQAKATKRLASVQISARSLTSTELEASNRGFRCNSCSRVI